MTSHEVLTAELDALWVPLLGYWSELRLGGRVGERVVRLPGGEVVVEGGRVDGAVVENDAPSVELYGGQTAVTAQRHADVTM